MTTRTVGGVTYALTYDEESRLTRVTGGTNAASYGYDGDGKRITAAVGSDVTVYIGDYYEKTGATAKTYYSLGGARVAMRNGGTLSWLLADHLGSTTINADTSAVRQGELR